MKENVTIMTVLQELRDFRKENNERWEQNEKRWKENDERWEQNEKRWKENDKQWEANDKRLGAMDNRLDSMDKRVSHLEEGRKKDRNEILDVLDSMQKSINKQFVDMRDYMDAQFEKINAIHTVNDIEHAEFRQLLKAYGIRIDLQSSRITYLEKWKKDLDESGMVAVN